jgi:regulator of CtrA degradation
MSTLQQMDRGLHMRLVDSLYVEAMVMADAARDYFTTQKDDGRDTMAMIVRLAFSCESLKVTTRLLHVIAWLMAQRGWQRGEIDDAAIGQSQYRLGEAAVTESAALVGFPFAARALIVASADLYDRVARLQARIHRAPEDREGAGPARALIDRLERTF